MKKLFIIAGLALVAAGCYNDKGDKLYPSPAAAVCDTTTITFSAHVLPIFNASCNLSGCHNTAGAPSSGGYDLSSYADARRAAVTGNKLLGDIRWESGHSPMPKGLPKLSDCEINKITRWVNQGALNN